MQMKQIEGHEECAAFRAQQALVFDMLDYILITPTKPSICTSP